jgi:hypothetical protein
MPYVGFLRHYPASCTPSKASLYLNTTTQYTYEVNYGTYIGKKIQKKMTSQFIFIFKSSAPSN